MHFISPCPLLTLSHVSLQKYIIDLAYSTAREFVLDGKHKEAIPAALHALRFSTEVYGSSSVQLVPAYLLLAEASTGKYCLNSNTGKDETSCGSGFWFPFTIYQGRTSSAVSTLCHASTLPWLKGISERFEKSHPTPPFFCVGLGDERSMKARETFSPSLPVPTTEAI